MSRQARRWIALGVLATVLAVTFVMLGRWQLSRLDERRAANAIVVAHRDMPVQPYGQVMGGPIGDDDQWFQVTATGTYLPEQFQVRYRSLDGAYGSEVVAVLQTDAGDHLLVDRGFLQREGSRPDGDVPAVTPGEVTVTGYVRRNERGDSIAMEPHEGQIRLISSEALGESLGLDLLDGFIALSESTPADVGGLTPVPPPDLSEGPHLSYALQWVAFTVVGVIGVGVLVRADIRDRRKASAKAAA